MNFLNDFIISMIESSNKIKILKIKQEQTSEFSNRLYIEYIDQGQNRLYISTIVYPGESEEIKNMIGKTKEKTNELRNLTLKLHKDKYNHIIFKSLEHKSKLRNQMDAFNKIYKSMSYSILKIEFEKYIENYTNKNKKAKFIEVYKHCMQNFASDMKKSKKIN